ncbi:MAG: flippase-like domain-containing protein [Saprospiraceae bacterium]|nr:flippase-like domain-containing protein [Saprospiraceae bacterium]
MNAAQLEKLLSPKRLILPILLGLGVILYLFLKKYDLADLSSYNWSEVKWGWLFLGLSVVVIRHFGYMWRIRVLSDKVISWSRSFTVVSLWEFASAVSPSAVGGTAVALFILAKEKVNAGKATTIALSTLLLDLLYFLISVPLLLYLVGQGRFFGKSVDCIENSDVAVMRAFGSLQKPFLIGYSLMLLICCLLAYGLFRDPKRFRQLLVRCTYIPFFRKLRAKAFKLGDEVVVASKELSQKSFSFWGQAFAGTALSWTGRFFLINCLISAFSMGAFSQLVLLSRYFLLWIVLVIPSTPGASGVAELSFSGIFCEFLTPGSEPIVLVLWRLLSYYFYLILGFIVFPRWLRRVLVKND